MVLWESIIAIWKYHHSKDSRLVMPECQIVWEYWDTISSHTAATQFIKTQIPASIQLMMYHKQQDSLPFLINTCWRCGILSLLIHKVLFMAWHFSRLQMAGILSKIITHSVFDAVPVLVCASSCRCLVCLDLIMVLGLTGYNPGRD